MHMDPCPEGAKCDHPRDGKERGWQLRHYAILQHVSVVIQSPSLNKQGTWICRGFGWINMNTLRKKLCGSGYAPEAPKSHGELESQEFVQSHWTIISQLVARVTQNTDNP